MRKSFFLANLVAAQLFFALLTQALIIRIVGVGADTDTLVGAQVFTAFLGSILQASLQSVWLPRLSGSASDIFSWRAETGLALGHGVLLSVIFFGILLISSFIWLPWFFNSFENSQIQQTQILLIIYSCIGVLSTVSSQAILALRVHDKFLLIEFINLFLSILVIFLIYKFAAKDSIIAIVVIGFFRAVIILLVQLRFLGWPIIRVLASFKDSLALKKMSPIFLAASIYKTSPLIDKYLAAQAQAGFLTLFNFSQQSIKGLIIVLDRSITVRYISKFGGYVKCSKFEELKNLSRLGVVKISAVTLIIFLIMTFLKPVLIYVISHILMISDELANDIWWLLILFIGYLHVGASGALPVAVFHALDDTKTPVRIGLIGFGIGLVIKVTGYYLLGLKGLALGTSIYYIINMIAMMYLSEKKINEKIYG